MLTPFTHVNRTLVKCPSPPLASLGAGTWQVSTWTWANVTLLLSGRDLGVFRFAYAVGVKVDRLEPGDVVVYPPAAPAVKDLLIWGTNFIPARVDGLRCRLDPGSGLYTVVVATFVRNGTLQCTVPSAVQQEAWNY